MIIAITKNTITYAVIWSGFKLEANDVWKKGVSPMYPIIIPKVRNDIWVNMKFLPKNGAAPKCWEVLKSKKSIGMITRATVVPPQTPK